jgi:hypothetical protein
MFRSKILSAAIIASLVAVLCVLFGCTEKSEAEKLRRYYSALNADEVNEGADSPTSGAEPPKPALSPSGGSASIVQGTPRVAKDGYCGDGIINGTTEDCDQGAIQNTSCRDYGGIAGVVRCQGNCLYDISDCMTPRADRDIGGIAETCKCHCNTSACMGGCKSTAVNGQAACEFDCDNECQCLCGGKLQAKVEECKMQCICTVDVNGNPDCTCNLDQCDLIAIVNQNIATIVTSPIGVSTTTSR